MILDATASALLSCALGLCVGSALQHGSTCSVRAAQHLAWHGDARPTLGLVVALGAAGLVVLPVAWLAGAAVRLPSSVPLDARLVAGGVLLGAGALANGACLLGSLTRLGDGEVRFLALPLGLAAGFWIAAQARLAPAAAATRNALAAPSPAGVIAVLAFAVIALWAGRAVIRQADRPAAVRVLASSVVLGGCGALLFLLRPGWSYADLVHRRFEAAMQLAGAPATAAALATLAGAAATAVARRAFRWQPPTARALARSLGGGALMALGSVLVPGGNDALLLAGVPAAVPSGIVAWSVMTLTVVLASWSARRGRV